MLSLSPAEAEALLLSLKVAFWSVAASLPVAVALAWLLSRREFFGKSLLDAVVHLPLVLPPVVVGYFLLLAVRQARPGRLAARRVPRHRLRLPLDRRRARLRGDGLARCWCARCASRSTRSTAAWKRQRRRSAPRRRWVFATVTLPLILPGILTGVLLSFARSLGEFGATITFVSNIPGETQTLPLAIYTFTQVPGGDAQAHAPVRRCRSCSRSPR